MSDFVTVARTNDIGPGLVKVYTVNGKRVAICNVGGTFYAIDDVCTHDGGPLDQGTLEGDEIECPRHGARFDVKTGRVLRFPAVTPIRTYPVEVAGNEVRVKLDEAGQGG